jgi:thioredoxin-related protein
VQEVTVRLVSIVCWILVLVPLYGCGIEVSEGHGDDPVAWFDGDFEAAFELARQESKPLFLYWGAEWCPPCHHLKTTVFKTPEFVAKSREFVTVYLDGDDERAQILGEELGVVGYPTVLIFSSEGEEIMRMPTNIDAAQYVALLDTALGRMRPIGEVLAGVMKTGPADAAPEDLNLLAFYSWGQDTEADLGEDHGYATFAALWEGTPEALATERARFLSLTLEAAAARAGGEGEDAPGDALFADERHRYHDAVMELLGNHELSSATLPFVLYGCRETIPLLHPTAGPGRDALVTRWDEAARRVEQDEALSVDDRLTAAVPRIWLVTLDAEEDDEPELPAELVEHVRERVAWAAETVDDESELQTVMSTMSWLLDQVGLVEEAEALLTERMDDAHAPYYFMSVMASMKKDADRPEEAVAWYRKAYDSARGRYSRFRWGSIYLRQVMALTPEDTATIESDSVEILDELLTLEDAFAGGNYARLDQLDSAYRSWNEGGEHDALIERIRGAVLARCEDYPEAGEDSQRARCETFLAEGEAVEETS